MKQLQNLKKGGNKMKSNVKSYLLVLLAMVFVVSLAFAADPSKEAMGRHHKEATITGKVTESGTLMADDGMEYGVAGHKADELLKNVAKRVEIKGLVMEKEGKRSIEVKEYRIMEEEGMGD